MKVSVKINQDCEHDGFPLSWEDIKRKEGIYQQEGGSETTYVISVHGDRHVVFFVDRGGSMLVAEHEGWYRAKFKESKNVSLCVEFTAR